MAKKEPAKEPAKEEAKEEASNGPVILPNGEKRIDFIRDNYYGSGELAGDRPGIVNAVNEMLETAGGVYKPIYYQIVRRATKTEEDPRIAQRAAKEAKAKAKIENNIIASYGNLIRDSLNKIVSYEDDKTRKFIKLESAIATIFERLEKIEKHLDITK